MCLYVPANLARRCGMGVKLNLKEFLLPLRQCTARPQGSSDCDGYMEFSFCFRSRARAKRSDVGGLSRMIGAISSCLVMLIDAGIRRLTHAFFNVIRGVHPLHLGSRSCLHPSHQAVWVTLALPRAPCQKRRTSIRSALSAYTIFFEYECPAFGNARKISNP